MLSIIINSFGKYCLFVYAVFSGAKRSRLYIKQVIVECHSIGVGALFIISIVSISMGGVTCMQLYYNIHGKLPIPIPMDPLVGAGMRNISIMIMAPTVIGIIFAGRVGASIAGQLGSMRISDQIDALEMMGLDATSYLVLPKIVASVLMFPLIVVLSAILSVYSGWLTAKYILCIASEDYVYGLRLKFAPYIIQFALYKALVFAFLISSISAFKGFYVTGGSREVGKASTDAVTISCIAIIISEFVMTDVLLSPDLIAA